MSVRALGIFGFLMGALGLFLLIFPYYFLGSEAYIPKHNPDMGYFIPKYIEAWIMLIFALFLLTIAMIALVSYVRKRSIGRQHRQPLQITFTV